MHPYLPLLLIQVVKSFFLLIYGRGKIHTNNIEGFWSLLKRGISGVYHSVSEKYLQSYINEYGFRYNHRKDEKPMFETVLEKI